MPAAARGGLTSEDLQRAMSGMYRICTITLHLQVTHWLITGFEYLAHTASWHNIK